VWDKEAGLYCEAWEYDGESDLDDGNEDEEEEEEEEPPPEPLPTPPPKHNTQAMIAAAAGVSHSTLAQAEIVRREAPELWEKAKAGTETIGGAYKAVRRDQRKEDKVQVLREAASQAAPTNWWTVTDAEDVVPCSALITDPPYGILAESWEPEHLEAFTRDWAHRWSQCGADIVLVFWSQEHLWDGRVWFDESLDGYAFQQLLVWHYPNNKSPQSRVRFKQTWEPVFFYRRNGCERKVEVNAAEWAELTDFDCKVAAVPQSNFNDANAKVHPAQKPVEVMRWLVASTTQPGEMVCDPFCGSGTTGIAAVQLGRQFHGIELDPNYREMATGRIARYGNVG
jgi:hypothetical protein